MDYRKPSSCRRLVFIHMHLQASTFWHHYWIGLFGAFLGDSTRSDSRPVCEN
jgi:hypothetical protein